MSKNTEFWFNTHVTVNYYKSLCGVPEWDIETNALNLQT